MAAPAWTPASTADHASSTPILPKGPCNFRKVEGGQQAPPCGCRRFWLDDSASRSRTAESTGWCYCGHHACFHFLVDDQEASFAQYQSRDIARRYPSEPSPLPSTAPPCVTSYSLTTPSRAGGLDHGKRQWDQVESWTTIPSLYAHVPNDDLTGSATEVNTPSTIADQPPPLSRSPSVSSQFKNEAVQPQGSNHSRDHDMADYANGSGKSSRLASSPQQKNITLTYDLQNIIESHARRLDTLENSSFAHVPAEEIQDKFELFDGRLLDLEGWRAEQEEANESQSSSSSDSDSFDPAFETSQRLTDIEERLSMLEEAYPSYAYPWTLEVVLLPWGDLRGIWVKPPENKPQLPRPSQGSEEWNGLATPTHELGPQAHIGSSARWIPTSLVADDERLIPKAPGPKSVVFKRLRSRGLVRNVTISDCGAHHIWNTISDAFDTFLVQSAAQGNDLGPVLPQYPGIKQPIVPLRKIRHSPYLEFLSSDEMLSPAFWDFAFLKSGILMKVGGSYRLYVTTNDAYMQADQGQWSWSCLKMGLRQEQGELVINSTEQLEDLCLEGTTRDERYWAHHPALDHSPDSASSSRSSSVDYLARDERSQYSNGSDRQRVAKQDSSPLLYLQQTASSKRRPSTSSVERIPEPLSSKRSHGLFDDVELYQKRRRTSRSVEAERRLARMTPRWSSEPGSDSSSGRDEDIGGSRSTSGTSIGPQFAYATPHSNSTAAFYVDAGGDTEPDSDNPQSEDPDHANADSDSDSEMKYSSSGSEKEWEGVVDDDLSIKRGPEEGSEMGNDDDIEMDLSPKSNTMSSGEESDDEAYKSLDDGVTLYEARLRCDI